MGGSLDRALGRVWRSPRPGDVLDDLTALDRVAGHDGERAAAERVAEALRAAGATDVTRDPTPIEVWEGDGASVRADREYPATPLPYAPAGTVSGPVVSMAGLEDREPDALAGAIALARTGGDRHRLARVGRAAAAGAAGFLLAGDRPGQLCPTGTVGTGGVGPLPAAGISHETAARLEARDRPVELTVGGTFRDGATHLVTGRVGPDTDERVLLVAHHDAHAIGEGALDNAAGVAALVGIVEILAAIDPPIGLTVASVGGEEVGLLGSSALADRLDTDRLRAVVNCDGIGRHPRPKAITHGSPAMAALVEDLAAALERPIAIDRRTHPYSDHWPFLRRGVPALQFHSQRPDTSGRWDRGWTHTAADTREKVDVGTVRDHAMVAASAIDRLLETPIERRSPGAIRETFEDSGLAERMRTAGIWPATW